MAAVAYPRDVLDELKRAAEADPEREVCGFVVRWPDAGLAVVSIANAADPSLVRSRFEMSLPDQLGALRDVEAAGGAVVAVYHSHVDGDARLSRTDCEQALANGSPLWPGVEQLVIALRCGRAAEIRRYRLVDRAFEEYRLD